MRKLSVLGIKNHRSAAVGGGGAGCAPPPHGSASDHGERLIFLLELIFEIVALFFTNLANRAASHYMCYNGALCCITVCTRVCCRALTASFPRPAAPVTCFSSWSSTPRRPLKLPEASVRGLPSNVSADRSFTHASYFVYSLLF